MFRSDVVRAPDAAPAVDRPPRRLRAVEPITIVVANRQPLVREAVARAIRQRADLRLIGDAGDGRAALSLIRERDPHVALIGRELDGIDGLRLLNAIVRDGLDVRVLLVGTATRLPASYDAIAAGAAGWLSPFSAADEVCSAIVAVARGHTTLTHDAQSAIVRQIREASREHAAVLSDRERDLLALLADGCSPSEAGRALHLSAGTVKATMLRMYKRVGVGNRAALVATALRRGWIE